MWEWLNQLTHWHWIILGLVLLITEAFGAAGFFLGAAIGSLITGAIIALIGDVHWQTQIIMGAILASVCSVVYWRFFRADLQVSDRPELNHRTAQFIGRRFKLESTIEFEGRVQLGDTFWKVRCDSVLEAGTTVIVESTDETSLFIKALD